MYIIKNQHFKKQQLKKQQKKLYFDTHKDSFGTTKYYVNTMFSVNYIVSLILY